MSRLRIVIVCALLALVTLLVYLPVRHYAFVFDDGYYVTQNPVVQAGLTWSGFKWAFTTMATANWHPLTWLSLMLDCQLFGLNAGGPHLVNVFFHAANAVLLFVLLLRLTGACWSSAFIAALFAWHPLHVESVAWVAERKDVLSAFFGLLTLLAYVSYAQRRSRVENREPGAGTAMSTPGSRRSTLDYVLALFFFACGLMAKPMLVTLPFVFLLLDYWPLRRAPDFELRWSHWSRLVGEKWPFFALTTASCVITFVAQQSGNAVRPLTLYPLPLRLENVVVSYGQYLLKSFYPVNLAVIYPLPKEIPWEQVAGALAGLVVITGLVWRVRKSKPYLLTGWLWYVGMLVPVIGLVQVGFQAMADRYTYLPLIGVFVGVTFGVVDWAERLRLKSTFLIPVAVLVLGGCLFVTAWQLRFWQDSETLFRRALTVTKDNPIAQYNLGTALGEAGQLQEAIKHFREALRLEPNSAMAYNNLGAALAQTGQTQEAIKCFREALRLKPDDALTCNNLGAALAQTGHPQEAIEQYQEALRFKPDLPEAYCDLGVTLTEVGRPTEAITRFERALQLEPNYAKAHDGLGLALLRNGQMEEAIIQFRTALRLQPDLATARSHLGDALIRFGYALFQNGQIPQAITCLQEGLEIHSDDVRAWNYLGYAFLRQGQAGEAAANFQKALELQPDNVDARKYLAWILATCPEASLRNGTEAVKLAQQADQLSGGNNPAILATLAAAQAEVGHFSDAMATAQKALGLATAQTNTAVADALRTQIKFYQAGSPFRDDSLTGTKAAAR
jgi:Flp pilus assembly protein TadD